MGIFLVLLLWFTCTLAPPAVLAAPDGAAGSSAAIRLNNKGVDYYNARRYEDSISAYNEAIKLNPKYTEAYSNRGAAYDALNNPERAVQDYTAAIQLSPKLTAAYSNRASAYGDLGNFKAAIADWNLVIRRTPGDPIAYNGRGNCYKALGDLPAALKDFEKAVKLKPGYQRALKNRDAVRQSMAAGMPTEPPAGKQFSPPSSVAPSAPSTVASSVPSTPSSPASAPLPASTPGSIQTSPTAQAAIPQPNVNANPQAAAPASVDASTANVSSGTVSAAPVSSQFGTWLNPGATVANVWHHLCGNFYTASGNYGQACEQYSQAFAANPHDVYALFRRANALVAIGQLDFALTDYETAIALNQQFRPARTGRLRVQSLIDSRRDASQASPVLKGAHR